MAASAAADDPDIAGGADEGPPPVLPPDASSVLGYIAALAAPAFEIDADELKNNLLSDASDALEAAKRFSTEPGSTALFLRKEGREPKQQADQTASSQLPALPPAFKFVLSSTPAFPPTLLATMILIKRAPLSAAVPLPAQLQTISLGEGMNPYEALYGVITGGVGPVFDAWSELGGKGDEGGKERGGGLAARTTSK
jgi:hypothetical protein